MTNATSWLATLNTSVGVKIPTAPIKNKIRIRFLKIRIKSLLNMLENFPKTVANHYGPLSRTNKFVFTNERRLLLKSIVTWKNYCKIITAMRNFQDTFEAHMRSFISVFSICITVLLNDVLVSLNMKIFVKILSLKVQSCKLKKHW